MAKTTVKISSSKSVETFILLQIFHTSWPIKPHIFLHCHISFWIPHILHQIIKAIWHFNQPTKCWIEGIKTSSAILKSSICSDVSSHFQHLFCILMNQKLPYKNDNLISDILLPFPVSICTLSQICNYRFKQNVKSVRVNSFSRTRVKVTLHIFSGFLPLDLFLFNFSNTFNCEYWIFLSCVSLYVRLHYRK